MFENVAGLSYRFIICLIAHCHSLLFGYSLVVVPEWCYHFLIEFCSKNFIVCVCVFFVSIMVYQSLCCFKKKHDVSRTVFCFVVFHVFLVVELT